MNTSELLSLPDLQEDIERVDETLVSSVTSEDPFLTEVATHLISAGGKRLRPALSIAAALTSNDGPVAKDVVLGATAVELVHLGSLYHDDVLDEATTRRTVPSVNARWGNFMAIIAGDYLLAKASSIAAELGTEVTGLLAKTIAELCEGQVREQQFAYSTERTIESYEKCLEGKTASLLATSARIGALTAGLPATSVEALTNFGKSFGMAFQVRDDILDVIGTDEQLGKPSGNDLVEGVYTLPVIFALQEPGSATELEQLLGNPIEPAEQGKAREIIRNGSGVERAIAFGARWEAAALDSLQVLPDSRMTRTLTSLASGLFADLA